MQKSQHPNKIGDKVTMWCSQASGNFLHHFVANNVDKKRVYGWRCQGFKRIVPVNEVKRKF